MQEINDDMIFKRQEEDANLHEKDKGQRTDESVEEIQAIKEVKELVTSEGREEADKNIMAFLRVNGLNEGLVKELINTDLLDKYVSSKVLDFNDDDIRNVRDLWWAKNQISKTDDSNDSSMSENSTLSQNSLYLKNVFSKPLIEALLEIIAKKPNDPVEYLGHWLLHFKICEEQRICQKKELELLIKREKSRIKKFEDKEFLSVEQKEEEILGEDWGYPCYKESGFDNKYI